MVAAAQTVGAPELLGAADTGVVHLHLPSGASCLAELRGWLEGSLRLVERAAARRAVLVHVPGVPGTIAARPGSAESERWERSLRRLEALPMPTLGVATGPVGGAGVDLVLALDLLVAAPHAALSCTDLSCLPRTALRLGRYVGLGRARQLLYTGRSVPATEALRLGLVAVVSAEPARAAAELLAPPGLIPAPRRTL
jgi:hypothetical protein